MLVGSRRAIVLVIATLFGATDYGIAERPIPDARLDCALRQLALQLGTKLVGTTRGRPKSIRDALRLQDCPALDTPSRHHAEHVSAPSPAVAADLQVFVAPDGDDSAAGTLAAPVRTLNRARDLVRELRQAGSAQGSLRATAAIQLRGGEYHLGGSRGEGMLQLGHLDANLTVRGYLDEEVLMTGAAVVTVTLRPASPAAAKRAGTCVAELLWDSRRLPPIQLMFDLSSGTHFVWAREPDGDPYIDLQPAGYALAAGNPVGDLPERSVGSRHVEIDAPRRNSSVYPVWGKDFDPRGPAVWYTEGGPGSRFADNATFWNGSVAAGLRWNATGGFTRHGHHVSGFNTSGWPSLFPDSGRPVLHAFHRAFWGNQQWPVKSVNTSSRTINFGEGGWQVGRPLGIGEQPFYIEGVRAALDRPGEFWHDAAAGKLYLVPNSTDTCTGSLRLAIPTLQTLVHVENTTGVRLENLIVAYSARTMLERYVVPSSGDWSIHRGGSVFLQNVSRCAVVNLVFNRTASNAIFVSRRAVDTVIEGNDFVSIGESAVATVGELSFNDGRDTAHPVGTVIRHNHIAGVGVWGKQTSALFSALACRTTFVANVAYNGPRAGININDGFCGGHNISNNLLFNWVRETQDHGPINTWSREMTLRLVAVAGGATATSLYPDWNHIQANLIMNGPSGNRDLGNLFPCVDNDDGSAHYYISENVCLYGGMKNYLGQDKIWDSNLIIYPGRWSGDPCLCAWGGPGHAYTRNTCVTNDPISLMLDGSISGDNCTLDFSNATLMANVPYTSQNVYYIGGKPSTWVMPCSGQNWTLPELQAHGLELGSSVDAQLPRADIVAEARRLVGLARVRGDIAMEVTV